MDKMTLPDISGKKIIVIGTIFLDIKGYPFGTFLTQSRNVGRIEYVHGGVGRNVAEDLAQLGCRVVFLSLSEEGAFGADIVNRLRSAGVNTDYMINVPDGIGVWMAIFNHEGDVHASISKRQDLSPLIRVMGEKGDEIFRDCDGIVLEMDVSEELVEAVFDLAEKCGKDVYGVISNMNIARERLSFIRRTRCFVCNRHEAEILFDRQIPANDPAGTLEILKTQMNRTGIPCMAVTLDKDGSVYADTGDNPCEGICPARPTVIRDSTGAGDAFFSGVSAALICGESLKTGCETGTCMASAVLGTDENVYRSGTK